MTIWNISGKYFILIENNFKIKCAEFFSGLPLATSWRVKSQVEMSWAEKQRMRTWEIVARLYFPAPDAGGNTVRRISSQFFSRNKVSESSPSPIFWSGNQYNTHTKNIRIRFNPHTDFLKQTLVMNLLTGCLKHHTDTGTHTDMHAHVCAYTQTHTGCEILGCLIVFYF